MTLVLSYLLEGKTYSVQLQLATLLTVVGAIMAVYKNPQASNNGQAGVIASMVSAAAAAVSTVLLGLLLQRDRIGAVSIAAVTSIPSGEGGFFLESLCFLLLSCSKRLCSAGACSGLRGFRAAEDAGCVGQARSCNAACDEKCRLVADGHVCAGARLQSVAALPHQVHGGALFCRCGQRQSGRHCDRVDDCFRRSQLVYGTQLGRRCAGHGRVSCQASRLTVQSRRLTTTRHRFFVYSYFKYDQVRSRRREMEARNQGGELVLLEETDVEAVANEKL